MTAKTIKRNTEREREFYADSALSNNIFTKKKNKLNRNLYEK